MALPSRSRVPPRPSRRSLRPAVSVGLSVLVALYVQACSTYSIDEPLDRTALDRALVDRGVDPERVVMPYALRDDIAAWARGTVEEHALDRDKLRALSDRLLDPDELPIDYVWGYTGTAEEVFDRRQANCLAFTNLFVGMARAVDVPVYFMAVDHVESFRKEGDLVIVSDHVAVGYGEPGQRLVYDFSEEQDSDLRFVRRLSDLTAIAMFHSNRGAEALQRGRVDEALSWLRVAVEIDDRLMHAWVNLGVAERRVGRYAEAEAAYQRALAMDPGSVSAFQNLASLLRYRGRVDEAEAYEDILGSGQSQNPFTYLSLGDLSLQGGRFDEARRFYRRALGLSESAEAFAALGQASAAAGDLRQARRLLRKALRADPSNRRAESLRQLLRSPRGAAVGAPDSS